MNPGRATIEWLYDEQLQVDDEWAVRTPGGFRWWPDHHAQTVEIVGEGKGPAGEAAYWVSIRTDVVRNVQMERAAGLLLNLTVMPFASLAGVVLDSQRQTVAFHSLARISAINEGWLKTVLSLAAALQIDEATRLGPRLATLPGVEDAVSGHPESGMRPEPDALAGVVEEMVIPLGEGPSRWSEEDFEDLVRRHMMKPPAVMASAGDTGFTVEFPFGGGDTSLLQVMTDQPHPTYGSGLFLLQSFRVKVESDEEGALLALRMNHAELAERPFGYGFGSYAYRDGMLHFTAFFPNLMYRPGLLPVLYGSCANRALELSRRLAGQDWTRASFAPRRGVLGRLLNRFLGR